MLNREYPNVLKPSEGPPVKLLQRVGYDTRLFVWRRDAGRCCHCGSTADLQFDHVIPISWGGSSVAANVELLCGKCNREKSARLHPRSPRAATL